jgi:hypothetical protein
MKGKKNTAAAKGRSRKPRVRKETIRDLDPKRAGKSPKGGWGPVMPTYGCKTAGCPVNRTADPLCAILV